MILHRHHNSSIIEEYVVQQDNANAYLKFFSARFLQMPLLAQQAKDY
jgi:hypothetical protein